MHTSTNPVVVGLDNGGNVNNATVLETSGQFLVDALVESPSLVLEGPDIAMDALVRAFEDVLALTGTAKTAVLAVGLDTPGPASADGVISSRGSTNFSQPAWRSFDVRRALAERLQLPVIYNNDGNAAALYAHHMHFGSAGSEHSSIAAIVGTGLAAVSSRPSKWSRERPGWRGSLATYTSPWRQCSATTNQCPDATVVSWVTQKVLHR
jgi:glucokinase